jgi:hypothetical protein
MRLKHLLFLSVLFAGPACAYIDPGTGSLVLQFLLAGFFASAFFIKTQWKRIKTLFGSKKADD